MYKYFSSTSVAAAAPSAAMGAVNHSKNSAMEAENHVKHGRSSKSLKSRIVLFLLCLLFPLVLSAQFGNRQNPLYGKVYRNFADVPELANWVDVGGVLVNHGNNNFAISIARDQNNNIIFIFVEIIRENEQRKEKIIDTLNIGRLRNNENYCLYCFKENEIERSTADFNNVIGIYTDEYDPDKDYFEEIVRAWRLNLKTGKFETIENLEEIKCPNDGAGV